MPIDRFYTNDALKSGQSVLLEGEERKHLGVMRVREGESVELVNGAKMLAQGTVLSLSKRDAKIEVTNVSAMQIDYELVLVQALARPAKLDVIVEKGCELGVTSFSFFKGKRSEKDGLSPTQLNRLRYLLISAMKQSGRFLLPTITLYESLEDVVLPEVCFYGDIRPEAAATCSFPRICGFVNGPEKGFSDEERAYLQSKGVMGISLSDAVLRTETAAIAAASLIRTQQRDGQRRPAC